MKHRKKRGARRPPNYRGKTRVRKKRENRRGNNRKVQRPSGRTFVQIFAFFSIVNGDCSMSPSRTAALIGRSLISLYSKMDGDKSKSEYIDKWTNSGERIVILKGCDHKHLRYLEEEVKYVAIETDAVLQRWGSGRLILVLSVFGRKEELEEVFQGLSYLH